MKIKKAIAWLEIIGGIIGLGVSLYILFLARGRGGATILLSSLMFPPFILSLIAGYQLLKGSLFGINLSIFLQILEVPNISGWFLRYSFHSGAQFGINFSSDLEIGFFFNIVSSAFEASYKSNPTGPLTVGINMFAIILWVLLIKERKKLVSHVA